MESIKDCGVYLAATGIGLILFSIIHLIKVKRRTKKYRKKNGFYLPMLTIGILAAILIGGGLQSYNLFKDDGADKLGQQQGTKVMSEMIVTENVSSRAKVSTQEEYIDEGLKSRRDSFQLEAKNVYFCNATTGNSLYCKNETEKIAPASTTKMLTALVVLEYCQLEELVRIGEELKYVMSDASVAGLWEGLEMDIRSLLGALLLPSGNDAAYTLAAYTGRKISGDNGISTESAIQLFVDQMNIKANELGANNSNFVRPDGYDAKNQYTSAYDLALIAYAFMQTEILREISGSEQIRCVGTDGMDITFQNTDQLVRSDSSFYRNEVIGGKTGSSSKAGKCLVSAARIQNQLYIAVVMGSTKEGRFSDSIELYEAVK